MKFTYFYLKTGTTTYFQPTNEYDRNSEDLHHRSFDSVHRPEIREDKLFFNGTDWKRSYEFCATRKWGAEVEFHLKQVDNYNEGIDDV